MLTGITNEMKGRNSVVLILLKVHVAELMIAFRGVADVMINPNEGALRKRSPGPRPARGCQIKELPLKSGKIWW